MIASARSFSFLRGCVFFLLITYACAFARVYVCTWSFSWSHTILVFSFHVWSRGESGASFEISCGVRRGGTILFFFISLLASWGLQGSNGAVIITMRHAEWMLEEALHWNMFFFFFFRRTKEGPACGSFFFVFCAVNIMVGPAPSFHSHYDLIFVFSSPFLVARAFFLSHCSPVSGSSAVYVCFFLICSPLRGARAFSMFLFLLSLAFYLLKVAFDMSTRICM